MEVRQLEFRDGFEHLIVELPDDVDVYEQLREVVHQCEVRFVQDEGELHAVREVRIEGVGLLGQILHDLLDVEFVDEQIAIFTELALLLEVGQLFLGLLQVRAEAQLFGRVVL